MSYYATLRNRSDDRLREYESLASRSVTVKAGKTGLPDIDAISAGRNMRSIFGGGETAQAAAALNNFEGWLYAVVNAICTRIAGQPWMAGDVKDESEGNKARPFGHKTISARSLPMWMRTKTPSDAEIDLHQTHPALDTMDQPNPIQRRWEFMYMSVANLMLTGVAYWVGGKVKRKTPDGTSEGVEIWAIPSHVIEPVHDGRLFSSYVLKMDRLGINAQDLPIPAENVARTYMVNPTDIAGVYSPLKACMRAVRTDGYIQDTQEQLFSHGMTPRMAVIVGDDPLGTGHAARLTDGQRRQVMRAIEEIWSWTINNGRPAILDALIKDIKRIDPTAQEFDWMQSGETIRQRIFSTYRVNKYILGDSENMNRAQVVESDRAFVRNVVNPIGDSFSETATAWVAPQFDFIKKRKRLWLWIKPCTVQDPDMESREWATARKNGDVSRDEFRQERLGLPPYEEDEEPKKTLVIEQPAAINGIVAVWGAVAGGQADRDQAIAVFEETFGFDKEVAERLAGPERPPQPPPGQGLPGEQAPGLPGEPGEQAPAEPAEGADDLEMGEEDELSLDAELEAEKGYKHPGHADQSVHGRGRRKPKPEPADEGSKPKPKPAKPGAKPKKPPKSDGDKPADAAAKPTGKKPRKGSRAAALAEAEAAGFKPTSKDKWINQQQAIEYLEKKKAKDAVKSGKATDDDIITAELVDVLGAAKGGHLPLKMDEPIVAELVSKHHAKPNLVALKDDVKALIKKHGPALKEKAFEHYGKAKSILQKMKQFNVDELGDKVEGMIATKLNSFFSGDKLLGRLWAAVRNEPWQASKAADVDDKNWSQQPRVPAGNPDGGEWGSPGSVHSDGRWTKPEEGAKPVAAAKPAEQPKPAASAAATPKTRSKAPAVSEADRDGFLTNVANAARKLNLDKKAVEEFRKTGDAEALMAALQKKGGADNFVGALRVNAEYAARHGGFDVAKSDSLVKVHEKSKQVADGMDEKDLDAIRRYTSDDYGPLNESLRNGQKLSADQKEMVKAVAKGVDDVGDWEAPATVYRGVNTYSEAEKASLLATIQQHLDAGTPWTEKGVMSTSASETMAKEWISTTAGDGILFRMNAKRGMLISTFTGLSGQQEVVQKPGSQWKPTKISKGKDARGREISVVDFEQVA